MKKEMLKLTQLLHGQPYTQYKNLRGICFLKSFQAEQHDISSFAHFIQKPN